jgi:hypothetical protein
LLFFAATTVEPQRDRGSLSSDTPTQQEPCTLGIDKAPVIRGIKLGMTTREVRALYPASFSEPREGVVELDVRGDPVITREMIVGGVRNSDERLKGISELLLHFLDDALYKVFVEYSDLDYWEEATQLAKPLNLSGEDWAGSQCQGFTVNIFRRQNNRVSLLLIDTRLERREAALSVEKRGREGCTLGIDKAPAIRGIRLGMTVADVLAIHPTISESNDRRTAAFERGWRTMSVDMRYSAASSAPDKSLHGIDSLYLSFFGDRLWHMSIFYPRNEAQEIETIVTSLNMPNEDRSSALCQGFKVELSNLTRFDPWQLSFGDIVAAEKMRALEIREMQKIAAQCPMSPVIRGVQLGMSSTQFRTLYPRAKMIRNRAEVGELVFRSIGIEDARLKGINTLRSFFLDGKLYFLAIEYANQIEWQGVDEFVKQFNKWTGLPTDWEDSSELFFFSDLLQGTELPTDWDDYSESRTLRCPGFVVEAKISAGRPRVMIWGEAEVSKRIKRQERLKSPASFRP